MRKVLLAVFLIMFVPFPILANAVEEPVDLFFDGEQFSTGRELPLTVLIDGKKDRDMIVSYAVSNINGKWEVAWNSINITMIDGRLFLFVKHYSTPEGSIRNVKVGRSTASFDIFSYELFKSAREMHIVVPKNESGIIPFPEIRASRVYPDYFEKLTGSTTKITHKEEWEPIDKIILPSSEILSLPKIAESFKKK